MERKRRSFAAAPFLALSGREVSAKRTEGEGP
jgi:hypothetical protein